MCTVLFVTDAADFGHVRVDIDISAVAKSIDASMPSMMYQNWRGCHISSIQITNNALHLNYIFWNYNSKI